MTSTKNITWTGIGLMAIFMLLNAFNLKLGNDYYESLFWSALTTLTLLALAIYFIRCKNKFSFNNNYFFNKATLSTIPSQIKAQSNFIKPVQIQENDLNVLVGNSRCNQPYRLGILNTGTNSNNNFLTFFIPPLSSEALSLNQRKHVDDDEINTYCLNNEDLVWQIGPDYLGCRKEYGNFNAAQFKMNALRPDVKMIELKLSPAVNSEHNNIKSSAISINKNKAAESKGILSSGHNTFKCAEGMILFIGKLQELSSGKPVGFKLCINDKKEFYEICFAICKTLITPDFIVVESPNTFNSGDTITSSSDTGLSLYEALQFVSKTLEHYGLNKEIKIIAAGKINSGIEVLKMIALGADCVCAYQTRYFEKFHKNAIKNITDIMNVCGFKNRNDITLVKLFSLLDMLPLKVTEENYNHKLNIASVKIISHPNIKSKKVTTQKHAAIY